MHRDMIVSGVRIFAVAELTPRTVIGANSVIRKGTMSQDSMPERRLCSKKALPTRKDRLPDPKSDQIQPN
jgi:hypothetical protein